MEVRKGSLYKFRKFIDKSYKVPKYYFTGSRKGQIYHTRLRLECSSLRKHLYDKNLVTDPFCSCGDVESTSHFLLQCPMYDVIRNDTILKLNYNINVDMLLYGDPVLSDIQNSGIFSVVQKFIVLTKRF